MSLLLAILPQNHYHPLFCYHLLNGSLDFPFPAFYTPSLHVPLLLVTYLFPPFLSYTSSISPSSGTPKHVPITWICKYGDYGLFECNSVLISTDVSDDVPLTRTH
jgi:hypothetical protein